MHFDSPYWNRLLGTDEKIRRQLGYWAATLALYFLCASLMWIEASFSDTPLNAMRWLSMILIAGVSLFFILIRFSGSLALPPALLAVGQAVFAIVCTVVYYALSGPTRGATLCVLLVVLVFCTFTQKAATTHGLSVFAIGVLGLTMAWLVLSDPQRFPPRIEMIHFFLAASTLLIVAFLTGKLSELRSRLKAQKLELTDALARNQILATQDPLTSLVNRRHMNELLEEEERRAAVGQPTCLALLDLDWFKRINDTHGHEAGDEVLRRFATQAQSVLRISDTLARWGGEEFLLLMRNTELSDAAQVLARIRESVAGLPCGAAASLPPVTFSAGLVELSPDEGIASGIRRADHALYRAKTDGRNRVAVAAL